jgi:hypothetical protein
MYDQSALNDPCPSLICDNKPAPLTISHQPAAAGCRQHLACVQRKGRGLVNVGSCFEPLPKRASRAGGSFDLTLRSRAASASSIHLVAMLASLPLSSWCHRTKIESFDWLFPIWM